MTAAMPLVQATPAEPAVRAEGLGKTYGAVTVLSDVTLDILPGEVHAIIGENGAGKSTLMKIIFGAVKPDAGTDAVPPGKCEHGAHQEHGRFDESCKDQHHLKRPAQADAPRPAQEGACRHHDQAEADADGQDEHG